MFYNNLYKVKIKAVVGSEEQLVEKHNWIVTWLTSRKCFAGNAEHDLEVKTVHVLVHRRLNMSSSFAVKRPNLGSSQVLLLFDT